MQHRFIPAAGDLPAWHSTVHRRDQDREKSASSAGCLPEQGDLETWLAALRERAGAHTDRSYTLPLLRFAT